MWRWIPTSTVGSCYFCRNLQANQCERLRAVGVDRDGAFAEFVSVPARACYPLPDSLSDNEGRVR